MPWWSWDHPRMCGEHSLRVVELLSCSGSSPHVRGARHLRPRGRRCPGIIPACAGSTGFKSLERRNERDHPRMCGEHVAAVSAITSFVGSSPHVRGALLATMTSDSQLGIIPACAGSTMRGRTHHRTRRDHPRMCGEHLKGKLEAERSEGSSPHVRGAR